RNALGASRRSARETVTLVGHGRSCRWRWLAEITTRYAKAYQGARKKDRRRILDEVVAMTGWSRNARRRLAAAAKATPDAGCQVAARPRKQRADKFSYDARPILQRVWAA